MEQKFKDKNIVIIGAGSSVGNVLCKRLSDEGAIVHATFNSKEKLSDFNIKNSQKHLLNLENQDNIKAFTQFLIEKIDVIHGLVVCSGTDVYGPLKLIDEKKIQSAFQINLFSIIEIVKTLFYTRKISTDGASLVFLSSIAGSHGYFGKTIYSAYKGALNAFVKSLALELAERKIRANTISPAVFVSEMNQKVFDLMEIEKLNDLKQMHPLGFGNPEDVANAAYYLLSEESKWITGTDFIIDGGYSAK